MDKPLSLFLANVLKNGSITHEQALAFNQLATPHLQFEAVMALKNRQTISSCEKRVSLPQPKTSMVNRRWIDIAVVGLTIPLIHALWVRSPEVRKSPTSFSGIKEAIFVADPLPLQPHKRQSFHPKDEREALNHFMNAPLQPPSPPPNELTLERTTALLSEPVTTDAENAALEAMPITSRR